MTQKKDPIFGAAVLKLSFKQKNLIDTPGFVFVYKGILRELNITDNQVDQYIIDNKKDLIGHIKGMYNG